MAGPSLLAHGGVRWWAGPGVDAAALRALLEAGDAALAAGAPDRKSSRRKESFVLALRGASPDTLLKVHHYGSLAPWRRLRRSKARAELELATALGARGIPTVAPFAAGELRRGGLLDRCFGFVPWIPDAADLLRVWTEGPADARSRRDWTRELGALVRRMHDAGVDQDDLAPNNFLWRPGEAPHLIAIDFERARLRARVPRDRRAFALAKLDRHFSGASASARLRFLLAYTNGDRDEARRWWRAIEACGPRLARRDAAHWQRTGTRAGRRFERVALAVGGVTWRGFQRREARIDALRALLEGDLGNGPTRRHATCLLRGIEARHPRARARAWGVAQMLHQRRLMPVPLALLSAGGRTVLALARTADLDSLAAVSGDARRAALVVAIDRLLDLGLVLGRASLDDFGYSHGRGKALLLDPTRCEPGRARIAAGRRETARAAADRLLG